MNPTKVNPLLKKHAAPHIELPELVAARDPIATLVFSFLLWEATTAQAIDAYQRLQETMVDFNDLRVSLSNDISGLLGLRYPRAEERARRLRAALNDVFKREHAVRLPQAAGGKRDIRAYVESLEGMVVPYVAARVLLLCFGVHGVPADESLRSTLAAAGACDAKIDLVELGNALARHVKADHAESAHAALQSHVDAAPPAHTAGKQSARNGGRSKKVVATKAPEGSHAGHTRKGRAGKE